MTQPLYAGIAGWIQTLPEWVHTMFLLILLNQALFLWREATEKVGYNFSFASQFGLGIGLITLFTMGFEQMHVPGAQTNWLLQSASWQIILAVLCVIAGMLSLASTKGSQTPADRYHHIVIVPLTFFLIALYAPLIWESRPTFGREMIILVTILWIACMIYDDKTGRLNQPKFFKDTFNVSVTE